jgi:hypothetical protein
MFFDTKRSAIMLLQSMRSNIVQSIRAHRPDVLMTAAQQSNHHFLYANLSSAQSKQEVLEGIASSFHFPVHIGKSLESLKDALTNQLVRAGAQPGFVVVLEQLPDNPRFDREDREQLVDIFREVSEFWDDRRTSFRCFYSFSVACSRENGSWERAEAAAPSVIDKPAKVSKSAANSSFGMNMPLMSSAFDTAMWLTAA